MYAKKSGRVTFRSNRRQNFKRSSNFSNGRVRNKGNVIQQHQKYTKLAKEAFSAGDRIQTEYYYQFADHYSRLMLELGVVLDENENNEIVSEIKSVDQKNDNKDKSQEMTSESNETHEEEVSNETEDNDHESIESVPFISQPVKKQSTKTKKNSN